MNSNFFLRAKQQASQGVPVRELRQARLSALCMAKKNFLRSWGGMTLAPAALHAGFKKCCMRSGQYDGAPRNHYNR
jgi:hypothetical protein